MKDNEMDETILLKKREPSRPQLDDTQSMPPVHAHGQAMQASLQGRRRGTVHELDPLPQEALPGGRQKPPFWTKRRKRNAFLAGGFVLALLLGFFIAGYAQHQTAMKEEQARIEQQQAAQDAAVLQAKKAELERKKQELEQKRQELLQQAARAEGRNEQLAAENESLLHRLVDKVTGQAGRQQQAKAANDAAQDASNQAAKQVDAALAQAGQMLDDVNAQIEQSDKVQAAADTVRAGAQTAYDDHRDLIDSAVSYVADGVRLALQHVLP